MFGSGKKVLESQVADLKSQLNQLTKSKEKAEQELKEAKEKIADLQRQLDNSELEQLKRQAGATIAEYESLRDLYEKKNEEFDSSRKEKEESFARESAMARYNLENEISDKRSAGEEHISRTVKTFGETYNYYLDQIRVLMNALSGVAARMGSGLFSGEEVDLKNEFGLRMVDELKQGTGEMSEESGNRILIGSSEPEAVSEDAGTEEAAEEAEAVEDSVCDAVEAVEDSVCDAAEAAEETVCDAAEAAEDAGERIRSILPEEE